MARIPGLHRIVEHEDGRIERIDLAEVPPAPLGPDDPERAAKQAAFVAWVRAVRLARIERADACTQNPAAAELERERCRRSAAYFLAMWGTIYEPRTRGGRGGYNPWIPFARQVEMLDWIEHVMVQDGADADGVVSKCRDVGATWTFCGWAVHGWLFKQPFNGLLLSRKEEFVDSKQPKSLFWKIDKVIEYLPVWLRPSGFNPQKHRQSLYLENPVNGNVLGGESTNTNAGRGDRATFAFFDEAAIIPDFLNVWMGTADTTEHRFAASTESMEEGPDFYELHSGKAMDHHPSLFTVDWWESPFHDDAWYDRQKLRYEARPDLFAQEILRDHRATQGDTYVYPGTTDLTTTQDLTYRLGSPLYVTIDPGMADETALIWIAQDAATGFYDVLDGYVNRRKPADFYGSILTGTLMNGEWDYTQADLDLMVWTMTLPKATYYGDTYGDNQMGASLDTFYGVLAKEPFKINVNRDRDAAGKVVASKMTYRTFKGRRDALRWLLPRLRFADTPGAADVLSALQQNRFQRHDGRDRTTEARGPIRDWTTHYVSALEYFAAHIKYRTEWHGAANSREARKTAALNPTMLPQYARPAAYRGTRLRATR